MRPGLGYEVVEAGVPFQGFNSVPPSVLLDPKFAVTADNIIFEDGIPYKRPGYPQFGDTQELVLGLVEFELASGVKYLLLFTSTKQYRYNSSTDVWVDISGGTSWTGDEGDVLDYAIGWDDTGKYIYITNGKDTPRRWDGSGNFADISINLPNFVTCKTLSIYKGYLILGNVETNSYDTQAVVWSDTSDFGEFVSGNSGINILSDVVGKIISIQHLGDVLMVYTDEGSITRMAHLGGAAIFGFITIVQRVKALSARCIISIEGFHLFPTTDNFYAFDGSSQPRAIGDPVKNVLQGDVGNEYIDRSHAIYDSVQRRIYWFLATSDTTQRIYVLEFNNFTINDFRWSFHTFGDRITGGGVYSRDTYLAWEDITENWEDIPWTWDSTLTDGGSYVPVMGDGDGKTYMLDGTVNTDDGVSITAQYITPDLTIPNIHLSSNARWMEMQFEAIGNTVEVSYSTDKGSTWKSVTNKTLTSDPTLITYYFQAVSRHIRFRFKHTGTGVGFKLRWFRVWYRLREA